MGMFLGLVAAIFWGLGDFLARYATHRIGTYRTLFSMQFIGIVGLGFYLLATGELYHQLTSTTWQPWAWGALAALLNIVSSMALYRAFETGALMLVSPIAASYAAITILFALWSGEVLTPLHSVGIGTTLLGVIIAATSLPEKPSLLPSTPGKLFLMLTKGKSLRSVGWALVAALGYGTTFWVLGFHVTPILGAITPIWLIRVITPCLLALLAPVVRQPLKVPRGTIWLLLCSIGLFDTLAYIAYALGLTQGQISIVTILSSLYSVVTVILAWIFLRERLHKNQWLGVGTIFVGIVLVNL